MIDYFYCRAYWGKPKIERCFIKAAKCAYNGSIEIHNHVDLSYRTTRGDGMFEFPKKEIRGDDGEIVTMIVGQAGMGFDISNPPLAAAASKEGCLPVVSTIGAKVSIEEQLGREVSDFEASRLKIEQAIRLSGGSRVMGANFMTLMDSFEDSVRGAREGGANVFIAGAGLARNLPTLVNDSQSACVPIVSSLRALLLVCRAWKRTPDAVIVEGPLAGGHLGFGFEDISNPAFSLENIVPPILEFTHGEFPVIVAGGIWDRQDIIRWAKMGASGVQIGTRFLATHESGASSHFKRAVISSKKEDIIIAVKQRSPAPMPFRILSTSPGYLQALAGAPVDCLLGYMLHRGMCKALDGENAFCICEGLYAANQEHPDPRHGAIYTVGAKAYRFALEKRGIISVKQLVGELTGFPS